MNAPVAKQRATKTFKYEAMTREGKRITGEIEAVDENEIKRIFRRDGTKLLKATGPSILDLNLEEIIFSALGAKNYGEKDLARFTNQLATLIDAGVPIIQSLEILYKQEKSLGLKKAVKAVAKSVSEGKSLYEAMTATQSFDRLFCYMVKAGEAGGILDQVLHKLAIFLEKKQALHKKVKSAMTYPTIITVVGTGVIIFLLSFVVPQFVDMLKESKQEIPFITQMVMDLSHFVSNNILLILATLFFGFIGVVALLKTKSGKEAYDKVAIKTPIFKHLIIKSNLSTFSQTLSTLIGSGIPILDALDICTDILTNSVIAKDLRVVKESVSGGKSLSSPLKRIEYFPALIAQMIEVGENTGKLDSMLLKVSRIFEIEVEGAIQTMTQLIEPLILVVLGGAVAVVMVAMYLPIFMSAGGGG